MSQPSHDLNLGLLTATVTNALLSLIHLGCIAFGASWYRFLGAGEEMAMMVESGRLLPHIITLAVALVLLAWAAYAWAAAGYALPLPAVRWVVLAITLVYGLRGLVGFFMQAGDGRSQTFWWWSSTIALAICAVHAVGLRQVWHRL